ncbi:methenyltetrahydromethanopterin cyclohydrolase [Ancylobacter amanitiformis]|uniref:Methenyltetrahydromethanopterin cyclohydrolase n=1 Tax=Ancylobacter amanitiformis TaxID=217069 RepID=A0ABU0LM46_9HYPH|nr:methenyltetrahydromethanopterin cyclohydrolase [Ancylobacter amanitiformis]MDQ0509783.1 methenyltetrahydromethanopterin cyclohydrolase [Ancylobacter amanitiformis]
MDHLSHTPRPSVSTLTEPLVESLIGRAPQLRLAVTRSAAGARIVDAGIKARGGIEAGRLIAEICLGGLGAVDIVPAARFTRWGTLIGVRTADPVTACLASQYAGWSLAEGEFFALGSGPGRALHAKEELFGELGYRDEASSAVLVLEVDRLPPEVLVERIAAGCGVAPDQLTLILTPTMSLAGTVQVVARVLEVALHKAHALHFPLDRIVDGLASAPLPPPAPDFITAMGRTNDASLYGGDVHLFVEGPEEEAAALAAGLPSSTSRDYGRAFGEIFTAYNGDFYAMDPMLFSPARVTVTALSTGRSFTHGAFDEAVIDRSFA